MASDEIEINACRSCRDTALNHFTVTASISAKMWDNIALRFPVAHKWWFSLRQRLSPARSFDVFSETKRVPWIQRLALRLGARGIMQIMPNGSIYSKEASD
ncbi:hypothetical protein O9929_03070 [Vibrio lentus]|nr:hypothetical protein [Vibrio lentus]